MGRVCKVFIFAFGFLSLFYQFCFADGSSYLVDVGKSYFQKGHFQDALSEFKKALVLNPHNKEAQHYLSLAERIVKRQKAEVMLEEMERKYSKKYIKKGRLEEIRKPSLEEEAPLQAGPFRISGEYEVRLGFTSKDVIWKEADANRQGVPAEKNWRFLWGNMGYNTFDPRIYSSLSLNVETKTQPWKFHSKIVIDPWTFIGVARIDSPRSRSIDTSGGITVHSPATDWAHLKLKYWSNASSCIDEIYRSEQGNIVRVPEIKVNDGRTSFAWGTGAGEDWNSDGTDDHWGQFRVDSQDIDYMYRPFREVVLQYASEELDFQLFPIAYEDKAYTSDDPLILSNNHYWWEESAWLDYYSPSVQYTRTNFPIERGRWMKRFSFVSKDSNFQRLTFLRGFSFNFYPDSRSSFDFVLVSPLSLWDDYRTANSVEGALRFKYSPTEKLTLGFLNTNKLGLNSGSLEARNHVWGIDFRYKFDEDTQWFGEFATSFTSFEEADDYDYDYQGYAYMQGLSFKKAKFYWAYLDDKFYPGLTSYRYTRQDLFFSRHIHFFDLYPDDEAFRIGNSIDVGRQVVGLRYEDNFLNRRLHLLFDLRNVHKDSGKYIETISRLETTAEINPRLTMKTLFWYKDLPKTHAGLDPLINTKNVYYLTDYFSDCDEPVRNPEVVDGKDPSIGHFSLGFKYEPFEWLSFIPIYERTNDPGDFPRSLLSTSWYEDVFTEGRWYDRMVPTLYDQGFFDLPPYDYYSIVKLKTVIRPYQNLDIILSFTKNTNKYDAGLDDNINHAGLELEYRPSKKWTLWFKYMYTRMIDIYAQIKNKDAGIGGVECDGHHNFFAGLRFNIDKDEFLDILFGEFAGYDDLYHWGRWSLSSLDTQHLIRIFYKRKF